ncbi:hypothetical protein GPALN_002208 [Globodera pallida]|nr:hypothetical protein GPALN_002208 [Globodera pallida]
MAASDVFEAMFPFDARNADPSEATKPVEVPDVEVGAFNAMLSFIYVDDVSGLNGDNAIAVLYAAKKYDLPELIKACLNFPIPELSNVFFVFGQTRFLGEEEALARAIGISGIVRKTRTVFIYQGQTRVHLDRVDGLGDFLEFEVCLTDDQTVQEGQQIADDLLQLLNVRKCALIKGAYFDHLTK